MQRSKIHTLRCQLSRRLFTTSSRNYAAFGSAPAPPRLPKEEQERYEELQRSSTGAFSTPKPSVIVNQSPPQSEALPRTRPQINQSPHIEVEDEPPTAQKLENINAKVEATGRGEELHPDIRRGTQPEFEGERNPKTGESGGPKNEPLRWGGGVDWSYNGRVTDF